MFHVKHGYNNKDRLVMAVFVLGKRLYFWPNPSIENGLVSSGMGTIGAMFWDAHAVMNVFFIFLLLGINFNTCQLHS